MKRMMTKVLRRERLTINRKRVQRLMRLIGIRSLSPQPRTTIPNKAHPIYPYLLRDLTINRPNQVWVADIVRPLQEGVLVLGRHHGLALAKRTLTPRQHPDRGLLLGGPARAHYSPPEIFNTDRGQFTSEAFTSILREAGVAISIDGVGRALDNVLSNAPVGR